MKKQTILLIILCIGFIFAINQDKEVCGNSYTDTEQYIYHLKSFFTLPDSELTDTFTDPSSNLGLQELSSTFTNPSSNLQARDLSNSFMHPTSQYLNQPPSDLKNLNILSASILECKEDYSFWIAIHCNNINDIAGFQFELPNNLEILDVAGVRSDFYDFQLHHNDNGLILGFSMSGETIPALSYGSNLDQSIVLKLHVQADPSSIFSFPIKSILAGSKGEKLSFKNLEHTLTFKNNSMVISFIE